MNAAVRHGTPSLTSLPYDAAVSCEVQLPTLTLRYWGYLISRLVHFISFHFYLFKQGKATSIHT